MSNLLEALRTNGVDDLLPGELAQQLAALGIQNVTTSQAGDADIVRGVVLPLSDRGLPQLGSLPLQAPGLTSGLRFQLAVRPRGAVAEWALDLDLDRVTLVMPGLRPARERREPARATRLEDEPSRTDVRIVGRGVLRIAAANGGTPEVSLVDRLDDANPFGPRGPVVTLGFDPPSFFLGGSSFGLTVDEVTYDRSASTSPAPKPPDWKGLAVRRGILYMPPGAPLLGDVSLGVTDVFLGDPAGVDGTAFLEFGGPADTPLALVVEQDVSGTWQPLVVTSVSEAGTRQDRVSAALLGTQPPPARVRARLSTSPPQGATVRWRLPGGGTDPTGFDVLPGDALEVRLGDHAPTACVFTGTWAAGPTVGVTLGAHSWSEVTSVSGTAADLAAASFGRSPGGDGLYAWRWDEGPETADATTALAAGAAVGAHVLELRRDGRTVRRVRVDVRARGPLLVGCRAGVFTTGAGGTGAAVALLDVSGTYRLSAWHTAGELTRALPAATVTGGNVTVAQATIAEVVTAASVQPDGSTSQSPLPPPAPSTHAHVRFVYDSQELDPAGTMWVGEQQQSLDLGRWVDGLGAGAKLVVVGRCDDLSGQVPLTATSDAYNRDLAVRRAELTRNLLTAAGVDASRIAVRGEQSGWLTAPPSSTTGLPPEATAEMWLARSTSEYQSWARPYPRDDHRRKHLRRGDIYAYDVAPPAGTPTQAQDRQALEPTRQRALVPGTDPTTVSGAVVPAPVRGRPQFRVRIEVEWRDPAARSLGEAIPSRAEVIIEWLGDRVRLPGGTSADISRPGDPPTAPRPVWRLRGRWAHDRAAGSDEFTLSLDVAGSPTGIAQVENPVLAAALGLAPAVVGAADNPSGGDAALIGALIAALGLAASRLLRDGSKTVVTGLTIEHLERGPSGPGSRTRLTVDYTVELSVDVQGSGLPLQVSTREGRPLKLRYRGVGVELDTGAADWWNGVGLVATGTVPEVVDPGSWRLGPPLDELLRVTDVRSGAQSEWLEIDLALSVDLGVVKLSSATVRIVFGPGGITGLELRGLRAAVDIPATLRGEGALDVSSGVVHAGISLELVPLKVAAIADISIGSEGFVELLVGVRFPAPIPFANSGLGLFGVLGRFVSNGARDIVATNPDPVERELGWLAQPPPKYARRRGQYALGLGAVIGTVPDAGVTMHALGMLTVEFPRPAVIFGVIAEVLRGPAPVPVDQAPRPGYGLVIVGLVVIDDTAVTIVLRGHYEVPGILRIDIPVGAYFPYANPTRSWIHVGTDGQPGRAGAPVTITFLPDVLDVRVWAFVMVHGDGLSPGLMGKPEFAFSGFSIGFGAGWEIDWSAGPIRLSASAMVLAGFGTNPFRLAAGIWVRGELDLVVLSIAARGEITLLTDGNNTRLRGEFCGEVDCFFFSISGCVSIDVAASLSGPGDPPSPATGVDLVSRLGYATARAAGDGVADVPRVWPDTVPVVHFAHVVENGVSGGKFRIGTPMPGPRWSGSRDLQYAYRLTDVTLEPTSGPALDPAPGTQFDTAWWWPGVRSTTKPPWLSASESETRDLALLSWQPWTGLLPLTEPDGSPGDPGSLIGDLCEPVRRPRPVCLPGVLGRLSGPGAAILAQPADEAVAGAPPARLLMRQPADRAWSSLLASAVTLGVAVQPPAVAPLQMPVALTRGPVRDAGWRLASLVRGGQELGALGVAGSYDPPLESPTLVLEVCPVPVHEKRVRPLRLPPPCVTFRELNADTFPEYLSEDGTLLTYEGLRFRGEEHERLDLVELGSQGENHLAVPGGGLRVTLRAPASEVSVRITSDGFFKVVAFDSDGRDVASDGLDRGGTLTLRADEIAEVLLRADGDAGLAEICTPDDDPLGESAEVFAWRPRRTERTVPPGVFGVLADGREVPWRPSVKRGRVCSVVTYRAPRRGPWVGLRIAAAPGRRVTVVGTCGVRWTDALERRAAEQHRQEVIGAMTLHASGAAGSVLTSVSGGLALPLTVAGPPPRTLLRPDTEYRLTVSWDWQPWERSDTSSVPGAVDPNDWRAGPPSVFTFRTAALSPPATPPPAVDLISETAFDPRSVARYVTGAQPSGDLPHLLDDPIRITLSVDYLPALLDAYGYKAAVEVRPTDVAPGGAQGGLQPPDVVTALDLVAWVADAVLLPVERRVIERASAAASCVPPTSLGGTAVQVTADLEPDTAYDLMLVARRSSGADAAAVARRWHFRTSRYRDVGEVVAALGLTSGAPTAVAPPDVVLTVAWPGLLADPADGAVHADPHDDAAFDRALSALGLDPWPLSATPRTTTLWVPPDTSRPAWGFVGVLLEAPEPIAREGRISVEGWVGSAALSHARSTRSGTRVLLVRTVPVDVTPTDSVRVRLVDSLRGRTFEGSAQLLGGPRTVRREVLSS